MASRKQFHKIVMAGGGPIRARNSTVGGLIIGDYYDAASDARVLVIEMPKAEVKKAKKKGPVSKLVVDAVKRQEAPQEVTNGA
jgi:hypothetical protein